VFKPSSDDIDVDDDEEACVVSEAIPVIGEGDSESRAGKQTLVRPRVAFVYKLLSWLVGCRS